MKKPLLILACLFITFFSGIAFAQDTSQQRTIVFATTPFYPPFIRETEFRTMYGLDISVARSVCKDLNAKCVFITMQFQDLLNSVVNNNVDAAIRAITITPKRRNIVNFSLPYSVSKAAFVGTTKTPQTNQITKEYLKSLTIGVEKGTLFDEYLFKQYQTKFNIKYYNTIQDEIAALAKNEVNIILIDYLPATYWVNQNPNSLRIIGKHFNLGNGFGIAVNKNNPLLLYQINQALVKMTNDGTLKKIIEKYYALYPLQ